MLTFAIILVLCCAITFLSGVLVGLDGPVPQALHYINKQLNIILMNQAELKTALDGARSEIAVIRKEQEDRYNAERALVLSLTAKVEELTELIEQGGVVAPEVTESLTGLLDDLKAFNETIPTA